MATTASSLLSDVRPVAAQALDLLKGHWPALIALYFVSRIFYLVCLHPLAKYPGPAAAKVTDLWKSYNAGKQRYRTVLAELHRRHGDIVRIGPNEASSLSMHDVDDADALSQVSIIAPEDIKEMYGHKTAFLKGPFYQVRSPPSSPCLLLIDLFS